MKPAWGNPVGLKIRAIGEKGNNLFIASLGCENDLKRVLGGSPWMVGRHAVILQEYDESLKPSKIAFDKMEIWVRILNLLVGWMNRQRGVRALDLIGSVIGIDVHKDGEASGPFLRGRVAIEVAKPIRRGVLLKTKKDGVPEWFEIQFEKLPFFCKSCGVMGHSELECANPAARNAQGKLPWDLHLRITEERRKKVQSFPAAVAVSFGSGSSSSSHQGRSSAARKDDKKSMDSGKRSGEGEEDEITSTLKPVAHETERAEKVLVSTANCQLFQSKKLEGEPQVRKRKLKGLDQRVLTNSRPKVPVVSSALVPIGIVNAQMNQLVDILRKALNFPNGVGVGSFGRGGGLALLWTKELCVQLQTYDKLHIDVMIMDPVTDSELWRFTGFYGDFNEILDASEQFGGVGRLERQMDGFRDAVAVCGFHNLGFVGLPYTWDNRQKCDKNIKVRLDRALVTSSFLDMFSDVSPSRERSVFGQVKKELERLRFQLEEIQRKSIGSGPSREERKLMVRLAELLSREETMERQRSRINWLKEGDRNTRFFQASARERSRVNKITGLRTSDGLSAMAQSEMECLVLSFYKDLFSAQCNSEPDEVLQHVTARVTDVMNEQLLKPFSSEEVKKSLFMMGPNKSPEPDGFTTGFYQHHWEDIGPSLTSSVLDFLNGATVSDGLNQTTVVLIPKVIANRLKLLLEEVISEEQSAFVPERLITANVLVAYECTHYLKRKKGKSGACAIKLDLAKAYDRVEWDYLHGMLLKLGFAESFVNLVQ
ncbi:uncharacterized protein LOC121056051 [Oryza brachyantha]|uniref:uncharacterized protein LOC121056051 n=1 Tax=Oryza brachyantha TaxID=4533 RepID=UPI001ADD09D0|nr:uncharacterized protein LOC121056051 [Oryza brachyantha]